MKRLEDEIEETLKKHFNGSIQHLNANGGLASSWGVYNLQPAALALAIVEEIMNKRFKDQINAKA